MKFYTAILSLACLASHAAAFSAVAPNSPRAAAAAANGGGAPVASSGPVDKTMEGVDAEGSFDPTKGGNPALKRNNNNEVWVDQVRKINITSFCFWVDEEVEEAVEILNIWNKIYQGYFAFCG